MTSNKCKVGGSPRGQNWLSPFSGFQRRRIMAALRRAHRVLGFKRNDLGTGAFSLGRNAVVAKIAGVSVAAIVANMGFGGSAMADCVWVNTSFFCGAGATASLNSIALGMDAKTKSSGAIALGNSSGGEGYMSIAIGNGALSKSDGTVAIGISTSAEGLNSIAFGRGATVNVSSGVALGASSIAGTADGVIGYDPSGTNRSSDATGVWKSGLAAVSIGDVATGKTRQINSLAAGTQDTDAVNVAQLKAVNSKADTANETANKGWTLQANGDTATQVKPGDAVQFKDGKNVKVTRSGSDITVATADDLTATSMTTGNSRLDTSGLTISGGPSVTSSGINAGGKKITGVAAGSVASGSTDAVNGGQLFATNQTLETVNSKADMATATANKGWTLQANGGTATQVKPGDAVQFKNGNNVSITRNGNDITVATADDLKGKSITFGNNLLDADKLLIRGDNQSVAIVDNEGLHIGGGPSVTTLGINAGDKNITRVAAGGLANGSKDAVNGGQLFAMGDSAKSVLGGNAAYDTTTGKLGMSNIGGTNKDTVDGAIGAVNGKADTATATANTAKSTADIANATAIAANETAGKGWTIQANGDTATQVKPGDAVQFKDGKNVKVARNGNNITIAMADELTATSMTTGNSRLDTNGLRIADGTNTTTLGISGLTIAGGPSVTSSGIDAGGKKVTGVAAGAVANGSTDAVNGGQLFAVDQRISDLSGGKATGVERGSDGTVVLVAKDGTASNPGASQKLTNLADGSVAAGSKEAVNGGQLFATNQTLEAVSGKADTATATADTAKSTADAASVTANKGWTLSVQGKDEAKVGPGDALDISGADGNIKVTKKKDGLMFDLADDLTVKNSVSVGGSRLDANGVSVGGTLYGANGFSIAGGPSILASGIDAGGKRITGLSAGTIGNASTDAVNGSQLFALGDSIATALGGQYDLATGKVIGVTSGGSGGSQGTGQDSATIGNGATASGNGSTAIGKDATASGDNSIATGNGADASGKGGIAIGPDTKAEGPSSTVIGDGSKVTGTGSSNSTAAGAGNTIADSSNTSALGSGNSASGTTDANLIGTGNTVQGGGSNSIVGSGNTLENGNRNVVAGYDNTLGKNLEDSQIIASGGTVADDVKGGVLIGKEGTVKADNGIAIGTGAVASNKGDVALGAGSVTQAAVQTGKMAIDGKDYAVAGGKPVSTVSLGDNGNERTITNVAAGRVNADSTDAVNGSQLHATNQAVEQVSRNSLQYDRDANGMKTNTLTLQGGDPNAPVLVANVAAGKVDTDAVNVRQLKDVSAATLSSSYSYTDTKTLAAITSANSYTDTKSAQTLASANAYTDSKFGQLSSQLGDVRKEARQAAAIGLAAASLRYDDRPGKVSAAIGGGAWGGQGALAMGLGWTSPDQRMRASVSATTAGGQWGVGAGLSFTFD